MTPHDAGAARHRRSVLACIIDTLENEIAALERAARLRRRRLAAMRSRIAALHDAIETGTAPSSHVRFPNCRVPGQA